jgi:small-conductance mechanosensitive channel
VPEVGTLVGPHAVILADSADIWRNLITNLDNPSWVLPRGGLTLLVLILALAVARWLSSLASRVPVSVDGQQDAVGATAESRIYNKRGGLSRWLGGLTRASIWLAAFLTIGFIWLPSKNAVSVTDLEDAAKYLAGHLGASLLVIACTLAVGRILQRGIVASLSHSRVNRNLTLLAGRLIFSAALVVGLIVVLTIWGTGIVLPVTLLGTLTVALSLALQDVLKNLVAGVYLLLERPFVIGDHIALTPYSGEVEDIQIRYTSLRTVDGQRVLIPNSMLFSSAVVNKSFYRQRRGALTVTVPDVGSDGLDRAAEHIRAALDAVPQVLSDPTPEVILSRASAGTVDLRVVFWMPTESTGKNGAIVSQVMENVRTHVKDAEVSVLDAAAATPA